MINSHEKYLEFPYHLMQRPSMHPSLPKKRQGEKVEQVRQSEKIKRNDICHLCESGKKYKKCCFVIG